MSVQPQAYGRSLHRFRAADHRAPTGPPALWSDHPRRAPLELPLWGVSMRQIGGSQRFSDEVSYRMARVSMVVALSHNLALTLDPFGLEVHLANVDPDMRGFAVEGLGMGLFVREAAGEPSSTLNGFLSTVGVRFSGLAFTGVGLGHVHAAVGFDPACLTRWTGLGRWMVLDGLGFWAAKTDWGRFGVAGEVWPGVDGAHQRLFDRGLGRSAWFEHGAQVEAIAGWLRAFPAPRRHDVALGLGVAATFTGGVEAEDLVRLRAVLPEFTDDFAAGALNASETRYAAGIDTPYTARAVQALAGRSVRRAYEAAQAARARVAGDGLEDALAWYEELRAANRV